MSHQLKDLLAAWYARRDEDWVLGTVYKTEGSAYRKAGAFMLIDNLGQQYGMLSGGCLESDIVLNARKVLHSGEPVLLQYDASDEDDLSFQLGVGCGGKVHIMLQPLSADDDLDLSAMYQSLQSREGGLYHQRIGGHEGFFKPGGNPRMARAVMESRADGDWLITPVMPPPHLMIVGGGVDAQPVVELAALLGWEVSLADPRPANARRERFSSAGTILRELGGTLVDHMRDQRVDAAILMSHNVQLDAEALGCCQQVELSYVALLGPRHRYHQVVEQAGLSEQSLRRTVSAPAGLDIGGQLPESVALSMMSECHAVLHEAQSMPSLRLAAV